jgi:hypothetical protein
VNKKQWGIGADAPVALPKDAKEAVATSPNDAPNLSTAKLEAVEVREIESERV